MIKLYALKFVSEHESESRVVHTFRWTRNGKSMKKMADRCSCIESQGMIVENGWKEKHNKKFTLGS